MLDLKWIRDNPELVKNGLNAKSTEFDLEELLSLDRDRRALLQEVEGLRAKRNEANDGISRLKKEGKPADSLISDLKTVSQKIKDIDDKVGEIIDKLDFLLYTIPNIPDISVPVGKGTSANKVVRTWGDPRKFDFKPKEHLELGTTLGWLSMEWGSKIAGTAFPVYKGKGAKLERALISFMLDMHVNRHGYEEVWPPALVNKSSMTGTGQLPKFEEDMYRLRDDEFFLIPTAEVPVTNLLRDTMLAEKDLPVRFTAYSPCFRREAGSYGKDTRGLSRVHQFDKIEMVKFVLPENSMAELESLVCDAEEVLQALELPYRVVLLGSGDMSFASAKTYDLEVWAPGAQRWYEVSSCSNFGDFQARRMNIRYRSEKTQKTEYVHTLNGSGVALARTVLCLLENGQTADGGVIFPKALETYLER